MGRVDGTARVQLSGGQTLLLYGPLGGVVGMLFLKGVMAMKEKEDKIIPAVKSEPKMFPIRNISTRRIMEAFIENQEFFLGIGGKFNSDNVGVYVVCMFSKVEWERM
ncbi:MAG: hypothetical protein KGL39_39470 [Patescibacteria group bacterium]|nr:hypothetical protein [Patescibacteria group bacterium]